MKWLPWLVFAVFGFYLVGNNFSAKLGMIDDHEIAMFLGSDGKVGLNEFVPTVMNTEVGKWGEYLRYRPSYYTLRVLETALWGDNATLWYLSRYVMLVISMILGWKILTNFFPSIISYIFVFYVMTIPFWSDVLTRLGPSEIYAVPAVLLFTYGLVKNKIWMITLGYLIAIGAKENFLILFPVLILWLSYRIFAKKIDRKELIADLVMVIYTIFIVLAIYVATSNAGADIYGAQISYPERFKLLYTYKRYIVESRHLQLPILIMLVGLVKVIRDLYLGGVKKLKNNSIFNHLVLGGIVGAAIASQYIFYNSQIPSNMRYDFPVMVLFPVFQLVSIHLLITLLPKKLMAIKTTTLAYFCLSIILLALVVKRGYDKVQTSSLVNAERSQKFDKNLQSAYKVASEYPGSTLVFVSDHFYSFEPMISVSRYMTAKKVKNTMVLSYTPEPNVVDPLGIELEQKIMDSMEGIVSEDKSFIRFSPTSALTESCYSLTFGKVTPLDGCPEIANF